MAEKGDLRKRKEAKEKEYNIIYINLLIYIYIYLIIHILINVVIYI